MLNCRSAAAIAWSSWKTMLTIGYRWDPAQQRLNEKHQAILGSLCQVTACVHCGRA